VAAVVDAQASPHTADGEEVTHMTDTAQSGNDQPTPPQTALTQARAEAQRFISTLNVSSDQASELTSIIDSAIDERFGELADLRIGRVIGAALATL